MGRLCWRHLLLAHAAVLWAFTSLLACRPSLPVPVRPLSASRAANFPPLPALDADAPNWPLPSVASWRLPNDLRVDVIASQNAAVTTATLAIPGSQALEACREPGAAVTVRALEAALLRDGRDDSAWKVEFVDGAFLLTIATLSRDPASLARSLARARTADLNVNDVDAARNQVLRSLGVLDVGGPGLARMLLEEWISGTPLRKRDEASAVALAQIERCLTGQPARKVKLAVSSSAHPEQLRAALDLELSGWPNASDGLPAAQTWAEARKGTRIRVVHRDHAAVALAAAIVGPSCADPDFPAFRLVSHLFGGGSHSRLQQALRDQVGLTYWTSADAHYRGEHSLLMLITSVDFNRLNLALAALDDELDLLEKLPGYEFEAARAAIRALLTSELERPATNTRALATWAHHEECPNGIAITSIRALDRLTLPELRRVARSYFRAGSMPVVIVGDKAVVASQLQWTSRRYDLVDEDHTQLLPQ